MNREHCQEIINHMCQGKQALTPHWLIFDAVELSKEQWKAIDKSIIRFCEKFAPDGYDGSVWSEAGINKLLDYIFADGSVEFGSDVDEIRYQLYEYTNYIETDYRKWCPYTLDTLNCYPLSHTATVEELEILTKRMGVQDWIYLDLVMDWWGDEEIEALIVEICRRHGVRKVLKFFWRVVYAPKRLSRKVKQEIEHWKWKPRRENG